MHDPPDRRVTVGRIVGLFGVHGWVKVYSHTRPREAILNYTPWVVELKDGVCELELAEGRRHGKGIVARLAGYTDRDQAAGLIGTDITVRTTQLAPPAENEYYWAQLENLRVVDRAGVELGRVDHLFETGANDVMVVRGEREWLIPFAEPVVQKVDIAAGVIYVDWEDPD